MHSSTQFAYMHEEAINYGFNFGTKTQLKYGMGDRKKNRREFPKLIRKLLPVEKVMSSIRCSLQHQ